MPSSPPFEISLDLRLRLLVDSYHHLTGKVLLDVVPDDPHDLADVLWSAPRAVVAHGTEDDPVFFYGNRLALQLFEMSFEEFTQLPSRLSAEAPLREERAMLLKQVTQRGFVDNYSGMRIAKSGRCFLIANGTVWNLVDEQGMRHGQAATFLAP